MHDTRDCLTGDTVFTCEFAQVKLPCGIHLPNSQNHLFIESGVSVFGAGGVGRFAKYVTRMSHMSFAVQVLKIVRTIVVFVSVLMVAIKTIGTRAKKCIGNNFVNRWILPGSFSSLVQSDMMVSTSVKRVLENGTWLCVPTGLDAFDLAEIANLVNAFVANYIFPYFVHDGFSYGNKVAPARLSRKSDQTSARKGNRKAFYRAFETMTNSFGRRFIIAQEC